MANEDYKNGKLVEIVREFDNTSNQYEINGIKQSIAVPFWRRENDKFQVIPKGSYSFINEAGNDYLKILDSTILQQATQFQIVYDYLQLSSKYIEDFPDVVVLTEKYNQLVDDTTNLFSYLKSVGMTSDTLQLTKVLAQLEPLTTWYMNENGEIKALPISDLYEKFGNLIKAMEKVLDEYIEQKKEEIRGPAGVIDNVTASVNSNAGTPKVTVSLGGTPERRKIDLKFENLKGDKPIKGTDYYTEEEKQQFTTETLSLVTAEGNKQISLTQAEALKVIEQLKKLVEGNPETSNAQTLSGKTRVEFEQDIEKVDVELKTVTGIHNIIYPKWTKNKIIEENGNIKASGDSVAITDEIPVINTDIRNVFGLYYIEGRAPSIHYYDINHTHIGFVYYASYSDADIYDMNKDLLANQAKYIRLSHNINSEHPLEKIRVEFITNGRADILETDVKKIKNDNNVSKSSQHINLLEGYTEPLNLKYISNGKLIDHQNWCSTLNYIPVDKNSKYALTFKEQFSIYPNVRAALYDKEKTFISETIFNNNKAFTTNNNTAFIRLSTTNLNFNEHGHNDFSTAYLEKIDSENPIQAVVIDNENFFKSTYPRTNLINKTWVLFGDSITERNFRTNASYHDYIRAETGVIVVNNGVGGSGYKNRDDENCAFYQVAIKTLEKWKNADLITIMGGVNDMWTQADRFTVGTYKDEFVEPEVITDRTTNTLMACFNYMVDYVIKNAPETKLAIISPLPCSTNHQGKQYNEVPSDDNCNMNKFIEQCKKSCALRGIPYLDLFHNSGLRPWDTNFNAKYFKCISSTSPDGLHPNELGHRWFYPMIREFLKTLL